MPDAVKRLRLVANWIQKQPYFPNAPDVANDIRGVLDENERLLSLTAKLKKLRKKDIKGSYAYKSGYMDAIEDILTDLEEREKNDLCLLSKADQKEG